jgi:uncharacterized protein (DUF934 family)
MQCLQTASRQINLLFGIQKGRQSMLTLIKNGRIVADDVWKTLTLAEGESPHAVRIPVGPVLVPLSVWQARRAELIYREYEHGWPLGIWLAATEGPEAIAQDVDDFSLIAVQFDEFTDEKYHSTAGLLRKRYGYTGELRAIGDVPHERLTYRHLVGFDSFATRKVAADYPVTMVRQPGRTADFTKRGSRGLGIEQSQITAGP